VVPVESVPFFTGAIEWIAKAYPEAKTMAHVAQDDLIGIEGATYTYAGAKANNIKVVYDKFFAPETQDFGQKAGYHQSRMFLRGVRGSDRRAMLQAGLQRDSYGGGIYAVDHRQGPE
jgi:hypothetical protein